MAGLGVGALGGAGAVLAAEVCAPLLLLCWLCCWPDDDRSDSSSGKYQPQKPVISDESSCRHRSGGFGGRRFASSAVSLHLPSTSGQSKIPAHRSHEEIRSRRSRGGGDITGEVDADGRYHSAPSVIDEVVHRRDWERSAVELYVPLKGDDSGTEEERDIEQAKEEIGPCSFPETRTCKKHYMNIKSSRKKETQSSGDDKDDDETATENVSGNEASDANETNENNNNDRPECRKVLKVKEAKQSLNESIRTKDRQRQPLGPLTEFQVAGFDSNAGEYIELDRSGARHHSVESRFSSISPRSVPGPPPSVEAVGYSFESYHEEAGAAGVWRTPAECRRSRHASAGDVLATVIRPQSGALSESELDWDLEEIEVRGKETAI
ncbi:uncharacterized protein LOC116773717 isoform X1 [Danaus plexippus]|uniref:uncharacterized protein LOC116773717 isoform X1 n=1 Tax=Danaus plexippus TaxID=13037 RepID=UPI002AB08E50|nr:uncharacterized protein LOC116773717 isoform X1 [Danaus plexippus]